MISPEVIDQQFSPFASAVELFASRHALTLKKHERGNRGWELTRPHVQGGEQTLLLLYDDTLGLGIGSVWCFACEEMGQTYYHYRPITACEPEPSKVIALLEYEIHHLDKIQFGYWTHMRPINSEATQAGVQ